MRRNLIVLCAFGIAMPALAGDGRIEINQAVALAGAVTGNLADDPAGFPVRIARPGSYVLTGDLTVADGAAGGILIAPGTDDVTLDLGGFTIRGPSATVGEPANACGAQGTGMGIRALPNASPPTARNVVVRDGRVARFGNTGIDLSGDGSRIEGVLASENCGIGIALGDHALIDASHAIGNFANGLHCGVACRVARSAAQGNGGQGIRLLSASIVSDSSSTGNAGDGIRGFESILAHDLIVRGDVAIVRLERGSLAVGVDVQGSISGALTVTENSAIARSQVNTVGGIDGALLDCVRAGPFVDCPP